MDPMGFINWFDGGIGRVDSMLAYLMGGVGGMDGTNGSAPSCR